MSRKPEAGGGDDVGVDDTEVAPASIDDTAADSLYSEAAIQGARTDGVAQSLPDDDDLDSLIEVEPDHYTIGEEMARGGMGRIMEGRDRRAARPVAIKEVLGELLRAFPEADRAALLRRFEREARITAGLQHPAIVPVYEIGRFGDLPFFAMKKVDGRPLDDVITETEALEDRLALLPKLIAIADALGYAHERGVIHRDLKPANVLVGAHGETVVIDWGLAKQLDEEEETAPSQPPVLGSDDGLRTVAGAVFGTPHYMPPEQARGIATDRTADVYAIGAMLYHLLAGFPPYRDSIKKRNQQAVLDALRDGEPTSLADVNEQIPRDLISIARKAMARDVDDRYQSAAELADDLRQFQAGVLVGAHSYSPGELVRRWIARHRAVVATAAAALIFVVGLTAFFFLRLSAERDGAEKRTEQAIRILTESGQDAVLRDNIESAGFRLVQAAELGSDQPGLPILLGSIASLLDDRAIRLHSESRFRHLSVHPDSDVFTAVHRDGRIEVFGARDGEVRRSIQGPRNTRTLALTGDGTEALIVRNNPDPPAIWDLVEGTMSKELTCDHGYAGGGTITPDGRHAFLLCGNNELRLISTETGEVQTISLERMIYQHYSISLDSKRAVAGFAGYVNTYTLEPFERTGSQRISLDAPSFASDFQITLLVAGGRGPELRLVDLRDNSKRTIEHPDKHDWLGLLVAGDGSAIVGRDNDDWIFVFDRAGNEIARFFADGYNHSAINDDGTLLAAVNRAGLLRVWDIQSNRLLASYIGLTRPGRLAFVGEDRLVALDNARGALFIQVGRDDSIARYRFSEGKLNKLEYTPSNELLAVTTSRLSVFPSTGRTGVLDKPHDFGERQIAQRQRLMTAGGKIAAANGVFDLATGKKLVAPPPIGDGLRLAQLSRDGRVGVQASGVEIVTYDPRTGRELRRLEIPKPKRNKYIMIGALAVTNDASEAIVSTTDGRVLIVHLRGDHEPEVLATSVGARALHLDPTNERLLISATREDTLWSLRDRAKVTKLPRGNFIDAILSPDGRYLVRREAAFVEIRDGRTGALIHELPMYADQIVAASIADDLLLVATKRGQVDIWRLDSGTIVHRRRHGHIITAAALAPGKSEYAIANDDRLYIYPVPRFAGDPAELVERLRRVFDAKTFRTRYILGADR